MTRYTTSRRVGVTTLIKRRNRLRKRLSALHPKSKRASRKLVERIKGMDRRINELIRLDGCDPDQEICEGLVAEQLIQMERITKDAWDKYHEVGAFTDQPIPFLTMFSAIATITLRMWNLESVTTDKVLEEEPDISALLAAKFVDSIVEVLDLSKMQSEEAA